jgi:outer membrane immunogenic protein
MKGRLAAALVLTFASGVAVAADMPPPYGAPAPVYKAPPPPAPTWTGCYIDGGGGYGLWQVNHSFETIPGLTQLSFPTDSGGKGWLGRAGGGCDVQFNVNIFGERAVVIGAFGDYDFSNIDGTFDNPFNGLGGNLNQSSAWYAGARIGTLVTPNLLTYTDGGYTQARFDQVNLSTVGAVPSLATPFGLAANTFNGWFLGGGTEYAFTWLPIPGLFMRTEYRYSTYFGADVPSIFTATGAPTGTGQHELPQVQTITTSLIWRFNWAGNWLGHW